jgi:DNA-binding winged helix-turn-helix (wHTH) protein
MLPEDGMELSGSAEIVLLEGFRLDRRGGCLYRLNQGGAASPVALGPRAIKLLSELVEHRGELVSKDSLMTAVWRGRVVEEANLNVQIARLRHVLDQDRKNGSCIQTFAGRGYCFVGSVRVSTVAPSPFLALPDRPSIAVLPFSNLSGDPGQDYFSDGIAEDIITALSRYSSLFVIARTSCFTYKSRAVDVKQVGRELGVRYVLEGSLRRAGNRIG